MTTKLKGITFKYFPHHLKFKFEAGTSRGVLKEKKTFFVMAFEKGQSDIIGWGEAAPLPGLSVDDLPDFEEQLAKVCDELTGQYLPCLENDILQWVSGKIPARFPSMRFAFETALLDLSQGGKKKIFDNAFYDKGSPIPINGLIWMGDRDFMLQQIDKKLQEGYNCIKMKIGAIDFDQECELLEYIRSRYTAKEIVLRVDANGAFDPKSAAEKLKILSSFDLHSIEQPIKQGQINDMADLCKSTPLPIALDEELIGVDGVDAKRELLKAINPHYIILKPTLLGGIRSSREWIELAEYMGIGWWMTSALEANIGLNAISQFTSTYSVIMPQGLGTGQLYHDNIDSPLMIRNGQIYYEKANSWGEIPGFVSKDGFQK